MKLLIKVLLQRLPPLGATLDDPDPMVQCKFFYPDFHYTWYAIEFDGKDICFGFVDGDFPEVGTFSLIELLTTRGKWGLPLERDRFFKSCHLACLREQLGR